MKPSFNSRLVILCAFLLFIFLVYYNSSDNPFLRETADCNYTADLHKFYVDADICTEFNKGKNRVPVIVTVWNPEDANLVLQALPHSRFTFGSQSSDGFSGYITVKGFEILKKDRRVKNIEYSEF